MTEKQEFRVVESLYPDFSDYADNSQFNYWMDYACELDDIMARVWGDTVGIIHYINHQMLNKNAGSASHDACVDVASNLEESVPEYKGVFVYE